MKEVFGYGRKRDKRGVVIKRFLNPYVNCLHTQIGHARENMEIFIAEFDMSGMKNVGQMSLEMGDDVSNTLTCVQKDNLVAEPKPYDKNYPHVREFDSKEEADAYIEALRIPQATKQGYIEVPPGSVFDAYMLRRRMSGKAGRGRKRMGV